jgi:hypothetical protein
MPSSALASDADWTSIADDRCEKLKIGHSYDVLSNSIYRRWAEDKSVGQRPAARRLLVSRSHSKALRKR